MASIEIFNQNIELLAQQLKEMIGLTWSNAGHPLVRHLISAKKNYYSNNKRIGCAKTTQAKLAIEDLQIIAKQDYNLLNYFKKELCRKPLPIQNYFGLRFEIRMAASLITANINFKKSETPDFLLVQFPDTGIECTSAHLDLECTKKPASVIYKIESAIKKKSEYSYKTKFNILAIDATNLFFHEGQIGSYAILVDKDKVYPLLRKQVNKTIFQSLVYFCYIWTPLESSNGVKLESRYCRVDRDRIDTHCRRFLDFKFPFGDLWGEGRIFKTT